MNAEDSNKRTAIVTGATGAIGKAIATGLAEVNYDVVLACRNERKARDAVAEIKKVTGNDSVRCELVELSQRDSIRELAARWKGPLHVLVNNACDTPRERQETPEGLELQFATNIMGYFWMIEALRPALASCAPSRIVNVASYWAGGLDLDDLQFERRPYGNDAAYRQSKQADRMLTVAFAGHLEPDGIAVNACHPGDVPSKLAKSLGFGGHQTPEQAAETPVWLATEAVGEENTGKYFEHQRESTCRFGQDRDAVERLYEACSTA